MDIILVECSTKRDISPGRVIEKKSPKMYRLVHTTVHILAMDETIRHECCNYEC